MTRCTTAASENVLDFKEAQNGGSEAVTVQY